jgi:hypothetical protein
VPTNAPQQIVPASPTQQPQHMDPHFSPSPYYGGYNPAYSQTPTRNLQPPAYLGEEMYDIAIVFVA